jgi:general secretion pathway protein N
MRALALLIGSLLIGNAEALAASTPLTVDAQTVNPGGGDLFAPRQVDPAPTAAAPVAVAPAVTPPAAATTAPPVETVTSGNPLWAIPMARLSATRDQPLFAPSRRPAPRPELVARPAAVPAAPPPPPPEPEKPQLSLLGTVAGTGERIGLFIDSNSKAVLRLKRGENHQGWTLRDVRPRQVELAKGLDNTILEMPSPDMKPGPPSALAAAPPPPSAGPPPAFAAGAKAVGSLPTLTNASAPRGPQPAQPANFVNPFAQQRPR